MKLLKSGKIKEIKELVNLPEFWTEVYDPQTGMIAYLKFQINNSDETFELPVGAIDNYVGTDMIDNFGIDIKSGVPECLLSEARWTIDWSQVETDTKVLVSDNGKHWYKRYFAKTIGENKLPAVWPNGRTSWSMDDKNDESFLSEATEVWSYTKLYEEDEF